MTTSTTLSNNIRFLRKKKNLSQEGLADFLGVKRSNIAAYETKNVEPRLRLVYDMAKFFDIDIGEFIEKPLEEGDPYTSFNDNTTTETITTNLAAIDSETDINTFIKKSIKIKRILEGFKAFYTFRKTRIANNNSVKQKLTYEIDEFIQLIEHLLLYNDSVIKAIQNTKHLDES